MLDHLLFSYDDLVATVCKAPISPSRDRLIRLLKLSEEDVVKAAVDTYCEKEYNIRPFKTVEKIPFLPDLNNDDFFQYISDLLKRKIS